MTETWTILKLLQWTGEYFAHRAIEGARLDAELILSFVLGLSRVELYTQFDRPLNPEELKKVREFVKRRALREPLAYLRGVKEFYSLEFVVSPAVLIPRPETELLVEEGVRLSQNPPQPPFFKGGSSVTPPFEKGGQGGFVHILDIGTGSGCIAVALAKHLPQARVWAVDVSTEAIEIAALNVRKHEVGDRVKLAQWDLLKDPWKGPPESFDLIVSNPPYVSTEEIPQLSPEISFEPALALKAGTEGLDFYPRLLSFSASHLKPGGWLLFEIGAGQGEKLLRLSQAQGFQNVEILQDLSGKPRVLKAQKSFSP